MLAQKANTPYNGTMKRALAQRLRNIERALADALPAQPTRSWMGTRLRVLASEDTRVLRTVCNACVSCGGKRWRPLLLILSAELAHACVQCTHRKLQGHKRKKISEREWYTLSAVVELIHTASLLHDDIEDHSSTRRGKPCAYLRYSTDCVLNAASWLYFHAHALIDTLSIEPALKAALFSATISATRALHMGQALDIAWHRSPELIPSRAQYLRMVALKTGALIALSGELGFLCAGYSAREARSFGAQVMPIGIGFQILDDVQGIDGGVSGKAHADDIVEGKKSFPVILHVHTHPQDAPTFARLFAAARAEGLHSPAVKQAQRILYSSEALTHARAYGLRMIERTLTRVHAHFPCNPACQLWCTAVQYGVRAHLHAH